MPRYTYRCNTCQLHFEKSHSITEKLTDCDCGARGSLIRMPSVPLSISTETSSAPAGQAVKAFIEDAKRDIEEYKEEISKGVGDE